MHHHRVVALELDVQRVVDRLDHQQLSQRSPPRIRRSSARSAASDAGGFAYACSKTSARSGAGSASAAAMPARISLGGLGLDRRVELVAEHAEPAQVALVAAEALVLLLLLDALEVDVRARIVGRRMRRGAVRDRLDERRPAAGARALDRLPRRLVDREHVAAVDAHAGHPVADRLVGERLGARLRGERRRDRPLVVVAEEDERRLHHAAKFAPSWKAPSLVAPSPK